MLEIVPLAFHLDIRLIQVPVDRYRPPAMMTCRFWLGTVLQPSAIDWHTVDGRPALRHELCDMALAQEMSHLPPCISKNKVVRKMGPQETCQGPTPSLCAVGHRGSFYLTSPAHTYLRQN